MFTSIDTTSQSLAEHGYIVDEGLSTSLFLSLKMGKALFLEGEPGVGKTEIAKVLARIFDVPLIRLQCYEGLDLQQAVYEWNYHRQLLAVQARQSHSLQSHPPQSHPPQPSADGNGKDSFLDDLYDERFLLRRPLLQAIDPSHERPPVLLIDELDRADEEFESFLLELLSDFQVTIPELGTLEARHRPMTLITSNRTREVHDALKRRCVYHWIDYPTHDKELRIVRAKVPGIGAALQQQVVCFVQRLREEDLYKKPGIAETLDWAQALEHLSSQALSAATVQSTLGFLLKYQDDVDKLRGPLAAELTEAALGG